MTEADQEPAGSTPIAKADLEAGLAEFGERMQREMRMHTLRMLGGVGTLLALFRFLG